MKNILKDALLLCVISTIITLLWQGLELIEFKEVQPSTTSTVIGMLFVISVFFNIKFIQWIKEL